MYRFLLRAFSYAILFIMTASTCLPSMVHATAKGGQRLALVIGNSLYINSPLANPANDAEDMATALQRAGFKVILQTNATQRTMERAIRDFGRRLRSGGVGLFYYAGHGLQIDGRNYLIPIDAEIESESDIKYEAVDAGRVLGKMEDAGNGLNIVILDACRDNPFARSFRSGQKGLAKMDAPVGSILAYATAPGSVAADGSERNGLYTSRLLKYIHAPGIKIEDVFKQVRREVMAASDDKQVPWESSSMAGDFYFTPVTPKAAAAGPTISTQPGGDLQSRLADLEAERQHLETEKKLFADQRRIMVEKKQIALQKAQLETLQAKMEAERLKIQGDGGNRLAYAPSANERPDLGQSYRLALFPVHTRLQYDWGWAKHYMERTIRSVLGDTLELFFDRKDVRLTNSAIPREKLGARAWALRDIRIATDDLTDSDLKDLWYRPSTFSQMEPNLEKITALGKTIGVDLVLMHKIVKIGSGEGQSITIFLIDVQRGEIHKEYIKPNSPSSLKAKTETLLQGFLKKHPLAAVQAG